MHGLALNVTTNLDHFQSDRAVRPGGPRVTSMERELGDRCPAMDEVKRAMIEAFSARITP
jgi:lipoate-protein ligase B